MPKKSKPEEKKTGEKTDKKSKNNAQSPGQRLADKLFFTLKNCWDGLDKKTEKEVEDFACLYKKMLDRGKTEREFSSAAVELLEKHGFKNIEHGISGPKEKRFSSGARIYKHIRGKALVCAVMGKKPAAEGLNILGAHIDSPRLDLKQNPLFEENEFALLDTHYYGGIKKYQWTSIPLAMHGVFMDSKGKAINFSLGEDDADPVFTITDLLPHLAQDQMQKKASEVVEG